MIFSNLFFIYFFLPICLLFYFICKNITYRNVILTIFSVIFYAWGEPVWVIPLLFSSIANYFYALLIDFYRNRPIAKLGVILSLITCLGLLGVLKYSGFVIENINYLFHLNISVPKISLPIGISFYTFQIISYILDCYWGKVKAQRNFLKFFMYVSMFPSLVAGPIVRYSVIENEIENRAASLKDISIGIGRFAGGLGKKVIIADNLSIIVGNFFGGNATGIAALSVFGTWYAVFLYALQVYFDFSGYSDMAIGLGRIFGFKFNENFNYPFVCKNITEFWQRWHISLGSFFRDYLLYIPVFGKRRQYFNLFLVWFCTGLWHGASWNYIIWGLYFGLFIFIERKIGNKNLRKIPLLLTHIYNKLIIIVGFGIFYFTDTPRLLNFLKNLIGLNKNAFSDRVTENSLVNNIFLISAALILSTPVIPFLRRKINLFKAGFIFTETAQIAANFALFIICSVMLVNSTNNPFLYFNF